jgi:hypothetical protein
MTPDRFASFIEELAKTARTSQDVVGLVGFGSTADRARADDGSDHDFAWLTAPGAADRYRHDLSWLPDSERITLSAVEHHGGVKVIYDDGHRLEFGIADVDAFATWAGGPVDVIVGDDRVRAAAAVVARNRPEGEIDPDRELTLFHTQLLSGIGRAKRGEVASASGLIRGEAVAHLLRVIAARVPVDPAAKRRLDPLDPRRRFDAAYPDLAGRIEAACQLELLAAARTLVDLAEQELASHGGYPAEAGAIVRHRLTADR